MVINSFNNYDLYVDPNVLNKALEVDNKNLLSNFINESLRIFINQSQLTAMGFKEESFHLSNCNEVKKIFVKLLTTYEMTFDPQDHVNNPNFSGIVYPATVVQVFVTPKGNLLIQKSIHKEIYFCKGEICEERSLTRIIDLIVTHGLEGIKTELPPNEFQLVYSAYWNLNLDRIRSAIEDQFYQKLEL